MGPTQGGLPQEPATAGRTQEMGGAHPTARLLAVTLAPARATLGLVRSAATLPKTVDDLAAVLSHLRRLTAPTGELSELLSAAARLAAARQAAIDREAPHAPARNRAGGRPAR